MGGGLPGGRLSACHDQYSSSSRSFVSKEDIVRGGDRGKGGQGGVGRAHQVVTMANEVYQHGEGGLPLYADREEAHLVRGLPAGLVHHLCRRTAQRNSYVWLQHCKHGDAGFPSNADGNAAHVMGACQLSLSTTVASALHSTATFGCGVASCMAVFCPDEMKANPLTALSAQRIHHFCPSC